MAQAHKREAEAGGSLDVQGQLDVQHSKFQDYVEKRCVKQNKNQLAYTLSYGAPYIDFIGSCNQSLEGKPSKDKTLGNCPCVC